MTETLTCQYPGCTEKLVYGGRGRPPKYCDDHKSLAKSEKVADASPAPAARPRPGQKAADLPAAPAPRARPGQKEPEAEKTPAARPRPGAKFAGPPPVEPSAAEEKPQTPSPAIGKADVKSRAKAEAAVNRNSDLVSEVADVIPHGSGGRPMAKIRMTASELIPTGQYANVSVGPALIECYVDLDRDTNGGGYFTESEKNVLTTALNELAEVVERDVIAVQRSLVMESIQMQVAES